MNATLKPTKQIPVQIVLVDAQLGAELGGEVTKGLRQYVERRVEAPIDGELIGLAAFNAGFTNNAPNKRDDNNAFLGIVSSNPALSQVNAHAMQTFNSFMERVNQVEPGLFGNDFLNGVAVAADTVKGVAVQGGAPKLSLLITYSTKNVKDFVEGPEYESALLDALRASKIAINAIEIVGDASGEQECSGNSMPSRLVHATNGSITTAYESNVKSALGEKPAGRKKQTAFATVTLSVTDELNIKVKAFKKSVASKSPKLETVATEGSGGGSPGASSGAGGGAKVKMTTVHLRPTEAMQVASEGDTMKAYKWGDSLVPISDEEIRRLEGSTPIENRIEALGARSMSELRKVNAMSECTLLRPATYGIESEKLKTLICGLERKEACLVARSAVRKGARLKLNKITAFRDSLLMVEIPFKGDRVPEGAMNIGVEPREDILARARQIIEKSKRQGEKAKEVHQEDERLPQNLNLWSALHAKARGDSECAVLRARNGNLDEKLVGKMLEASRLG